APGGDDDHSGHRAAVGGCVVRRRFLMNTAGTTCGNPDRNAAQADGDAAVVRCARRASGRTDSNRAAPAVVIDSQAATKLLFQPSAHARPGPGPLHTIKSP